MATLTTSRTPGWYGIPVRVALVTFLLSLLTFAVVLLFSIVGTVVTAALRGVHPDMRMAYRLIAIPTALLTGAVVFAVMLVTEIRRYRQNKTLSALEKLG